VSKRRMYLALAIALLALTVPSAATAGVIWSAPCSDGVIWSADAWEIG
jgi:hypothetical protein